MPYNVKKPWKKFYPTQLGRMAKGLKSSSAIFRLSSIAFALIAKCVVEPRCSAKISIFFTDWERFKCSREVEIRGNQIFDFDLKPSF